MRGFIAISAILHAGAIATLYDPLPNAGGASPSLRVSLVRTQVAAPSSGAQAATPSPQKEMAVAKAEAVVATVPAPAKTPPVKLTQRHPGKPRQPDNERSGTPVSTTRPAREHSEQMSAGIRKPSATQTAEAGYVLRRLFAAHFNYPPLARRKGWQGEVRLGVRLEPDGRLTHIRIVQSSGFSVLDNSAIKTAMKVERAPDAARWLQGEWFDMVLPVRYQLNGG
jgi:protein TonB